MLRSHFILPLLLSIATMQGADEDQQKINFPFSIVLANGSRTEVSHKRDFCAKSQARGIPWAILLMRDRAEHLDLVDMVRTYGSYSSNDFRSFDKTEEIICTANKKFLKQLPPQRKSLNLITSMYFQQKILYNNSQEVAQFPTCLEYELSSDNFENTHYIKVTDLQAILAIELCKDYVPAGALQFGLIDCQTQTKQSIVVKEFWNNFIGQLSPEILAKAQQQFKEAYAR